MNSKTKRGVPVWTDAVYTIPVQHGTHKKLVQRLNTLEYLYVSEDEFKSEDWIFLTKWMRDKKNRIKEITFQALDITSENLRYITEILINNERIKLVTLNNFDITSDKDFRSFCNMLRKMNKVDRLRIAINDLLPAQLKQLKLCVNQVITEIELIHEPVSRLKILKTSIF